MSKHGTLTLTRRGDIAVATFVVVTCAFWIILAFLIGQTLKADRTDGGVGPSQQITCQEDMACWDCHTMGNGRCGDA